MNKVARRQVIGGIVLVVLLIAVHLTIAFWPKKTIVEEVVVTEETKVSHKEQHKPIPFDPNKSDSLTLLYNGLKPKQINNLMKYRAKGGRYKTANDFRKLYGLTDSAFKALKPYIRIDSSEFVARRDSFARLRQERDSMRHIADSLRRDSLFPKKYHHPKCDTIIEINSADTSDLQYIKGIGAYSANHIVWYRNKLGGYVSPKQIREIEQLKGMELDSVIPHLIANIDSVKPLRVNYCSVEQLQRHPYLSFSQAKAIYTLRRNKLKIKSIEELRQLVGFNDSVVTKLSPYLSFEP